MDSSQTPDTEQLRTYLNSLNRPAQESYARRCGTTLGYLRKAISTKEPIATDTTILLERESSGEVRVEPLRPDVDWPYLRGSSAESLLTTRRKRA